MRRVTLLFTFIIIIGLSLFATSVFGQGGKRPNRNVAATISVLEADAFYTVKEELKFDRYYWKKDSTVSKWALFDSCRFPVGTRFRLYHMDSNYAYIDMPGEPEEGLYAFYLNSLNKMHSSGKFTRLIIFDVKFDTKNHPGLFLSTKQEVCSLSPTSIVPSKALVMFGWIHGQIKKDPACRLYAERYGTTLKRLRDPASLKKEDLDTLYKLSEIRLTKTPDDFTISHAPSEAYFFTRIPSLRYKHVNSSMNEETHKKLFTELKSSIEGWKNRSTFSPNPILGGEGLCALSLLDREEFESDLRDGVRRTSQAYGWPSEKLFYCLAQLMVFRSSLEEFALNGKDYRVEALPKEFGQIYDLYAMNGLQSNLLVRALFVELDVLLSELVRLPFEVKITITANNPKRLEVSDPITRQVAWPDLIDAAGLAKVVYDETKHSLSLLSK